MALVTTKEMFAKAYSGGYSIGAFNINNLETIQAVMEACREEHSPVILQASWATRNYASDKYLVHMALAASEECPEVPVALHLDHGLDFEMCKECIDSGFTSVMIDASSKPFEENIALTRQVVEYAHDHGVVVEAELGALAGIEDDVNVSQENSHYTRPEEVEEFVSRTGCDSLAIAIGTSHGAFKFKPGVDPKLRFDILEEISRRLPGFPIVLHGSSSVPQEYVQMINEFGGSIANAIGIPEQQLRRASELAVCKINMDSDLRLAMTGSVRKFLAENPQNFDYRAFLKYGRANVKEMVRDKLRNVLGSAGKA